MRNSSLNSGIFLPTPWLRGRAVPVSAALPEISSGPAGFPEINDRGHKLASGHHPLALDLPSPDVFFYILSTTAQPYVPLHSPDRLKPKEGLNL